VADVAAFATNRIRLLGALAALAVVVVAAVVVLGGGGHSSAAPSAPPAGGSGSPPLAAAAAARFRGIPQRGIVLGRSTAPVTLVEFADLKCPICRAYTATVLPGLVSRYVRTGRLRIELRLQTFVGEQTAPGDSARAARAGLAAGAQGRLWQFADVFYANQGDETQAYATDAFLRRVGRAVPGLDVARMMAARADPAVGAELARASRAFDDVGFTGTPSFLLGRTGGTFSALRLDPTDAGGFASAIDAVLARR
jgi:protein-disulfide isomerase